MGLSSDGYLCRSFLSKLVDLAFWDAEKQRLRAPRKVVEALQSGLQQHAEEYYRAVVEHFDQFLVCLKDHGASALDGYKVFFAFPNKDGTMTELFPNGISVKVTAENYRYFLSLVHNVRHNLPALLRDLPIDPKLHLSGDYYPVASFITEHLLNLSSEWYIDNEEDWDALNVTYCLPFNGKLFDVFPGMHNALVPYWNAKRFGINAMRLLQQLTAGHQLSAQFFAPLEELQQQLLSIKSRGYLDFLHTLQRMNGPFGRILSVEEFDAIGLTYSIPTGNTFVPLIPGKEHERVAYEDKDLFVSLAIAKLMETMAPPTRSSNFAFSPHPLIDNMPPSEKAFWDTVEAITNDPAKAVGLCFAIRVLGQDIFLKECGDNIGVTKENLKEYVDCLYQRQEMIHNAFVQNEIQATEMGVVPSNHTPPTTAKQLMESLHQYPPQNSRLWNTFTLDPEDENNEIFHIVNTIASRKDKHMAGELEGPLFFAIPIPGKGLYKLLPHGEKILVTRLNEKEFVERIWYEEKRLRCMASTAWKRKSTKAQLDATVLFEPTDKFLPGCSHLSRIEVVESLPSQQQRIYYNPSSGLMRVTTWATLDEIDMYKKNLTLLKRSRNRLSPRMFQELGLRYALMVGGEELELVKDGRRRFVAMHELDSYVDMAVCKLEELRHHILQQNEVYSYSWVVPSHHPRPQRNTLRSAQMKRTK
ncbi:hypothetical protein TraAM80_05454 [Trypanosoma rangeli]|uniref:Uncharacterized protein n=1 Tax=Trypanosoma rangeli TaxID=5698 RepID=A0A3R7LV82_TRYRA|nr:uncharacterized protein TraAM80_05454 [Trypanosoma rangeli]RNF03928.1 hypothetical protein TraAM80_05454 [Trypanosoma rangeli]|eukprot:RNF03928.1 hypothetical protein TraAM80_05454 [Trypanosoma rangeli]